MSYIIILETEYFTKQNKILLNNNDHLYLLIIHPKNKEYHINSQWKTCFNNQFLTTIHHTFLTCDIKKRTQENKYSYKIQIFNSNLYVILNLICENDKYYIESSYITKNLNFEKIKLKKKYNIKSS